MANGVVREATYAKHIGDRAAGQVSVVTAIGAFAGYFLVLQRRWPLGDRSEALKVGSIWLLMTVAFEFAFGRRVAQKPWSELLADYNVLRGRLWPAVLLWLALGPEVIRRSVRCY